MTVFILLKRWLSTGFFNLSRRSLLIALIAYIFVSWGLLHSAGEYNITQSMHQFAYYLMVTASTVGYGDVTPQTTMGKWTVALFIIPAGLSLFAALLNRFVSSAVNHWHSGVLGKRRITLKNHIIILGWHDQRTIHIIRMLQHEEKNKRRIVLCSRIDIENPMPDEIDYVKVNSFTDAKEMENTNIEQASCIIIDTQEDDVTLSAALFCASLSPNAHVLAYFKDDSLGELLSQHCPNVECVPRIGAEMLAKAAVDPGSSALHQELLLSTKGMTQYSTLYPEDLTPTTVERLFIQFKKHHEATLIALDEGNGIELNPCLSKKVSAGCKLFYIADERIDKINWPIN